MTPASSVSQVLPSSAFSVLVAAMIALRASATCSSVTRMAGIKALITPTTAPTLPRSAFVLQSPSRVSKSSLQKTGILLISAGDFQESGLQEVRESRHAARGESPQLAGVSWGAKKKFSKRENGWLT
jgi:hypothetical protein